MHIGGAIEELVMSLGQACPKLNNVNLGNVLKIMQEDLDNPIPQEWSFLVTKTFYVDKGRADTYTPDGSILFPFKEIQDAIDAASGKTRINIAPGEYASIVLKGDIVLVGKRNTVYIMADGEDAITWPIGCGSAWLYGIHAKVIGGLGKAALKCLSATSYLHVNDCFFWTADHTDYAVDMNNAASVWFLYSDVGGPIRVQNSNNIQFLNLQQQIEAPGMPAFHAVNCTHIAIIGQTGIGNTALLPNSDAVKLDNCTGTGTMLVSLFAMGTIKALHILGNSVVTVDRSGFIAGVLDVDLEAGSTLNWGTNTYDPAKIAIAGTLVLLYSAQDIGVPLLNPVNWLVPPVEISEAIDRIAAAVAGILGVPIP